MEPKKKILLIEDDSFISQMYSVKFRQTEYDFIVANNGKEGIEMIKAQKPNLILLDIILPEMDGFTLLEEVKKDETLKSIPIILLTNLGQQEYIQRGLALGANDYIIKAHSTPQEVIDKVTSYITATTL